MTLLLAGYQSICRCDALPPHYNSIATHCTTLYKTCLTLVCVRLRPATHSHNTATILHYTSPFVVGEASHCTLQHTATTLQQRWTTHTTTTLHHASPFYFGWGLALRTTTHCNKSIIQCTTLHHTSHFLVGKTSHCALQHNATCCNTLQHTGTYCNNTTSHCTTRYTSFWARPRTTHFDTLQHTATTLQQHCNNSATCYTAPCATRCSGQDLALQHILKPCNTLKYAATNGNTLQNAATHCVATHCNTLQHTAWAKLRTATHLSAINTMKGLGFRQHNTTHCNTLQHTATHCNTLQHTATHTNDMSDYHTETSHVTNMNTSCHTYE